MLGRKDYSQEYIDVSRARLERALEAAPDEPLVVNELLVALEMSFVHRLRTVEGKDGNPLNEVRLLCSSILEHGATFTPESPIKYRPEASVLGLAEGDAVALTKDDLRRLAGAFFADLEAKFAAAGAAA